MNKYLPTLIIILVLIYIPPGLSQVTGKVIGITDGDTFKMLIENNKQIRIRLHGIDCPEKKQDYGTKAKTFVSERIFGKTITIINTDTDRYGRIIAIVPYENTTINEELLRNGLAWHYCKYDKREYWHYLQDSSRVQKVGVWSRSDVIAPWEYRKK